jgi:hypothetical protein
LVNTIGNGPIVVERRIDLVNRYKNAVKSLDIQKCRLLSCKRGVWQVFGGRG